ncbi:metallophosphoesterase family protein [Micrococcales bacterium 31B]|nr:metallophosphoesterase family protein [Micrococcales bacterium 31B]
MNPSLPLFSRRGALGAASALGVVAASTFAGPTVADSRELTSPRATDLTFRTDGTFKVVQFNDTQDNHETDRRTVELMAAVLDAERPDFVVINGDVINGDMETAEQVKLAVRKVVTPMEQRCIPWAITFGNHDEDSAPTSGMTEDRLLALYRSYRFNLNGAVIPGVEGHSNAQLLVRRSDSRKPALALWLLDTGRYAPDAIAGQDFESYPDWDWVRMSTVQWYRDLSAATEKKYGRKIPGIMWGHIALHEHRHMWFDSLDSRTAADHERAVAKHSISGERNEDECPGPFNSGLFSAFLERGDVLGYYVGHDHVNTYTGNYFGVELGYSPATGYAPYGLEGDRKNELRGARVFTFEQDAANVYTGTRLLFARDLGIDVTPEPEPTDGDTMFEVPPRTTP